VKESTVIHVLEELRCQSNSLYI